MKRNIPVAAVFFVLLFAAFSNAQALPIEKYLSIRASSSPSFSPDGKTIAYLSNATGTRQVWRVDSGGLEKPIQLTHFDDNISFVRWLGDGSGIIFGMAAGGNENTQFYWMQPDGTAVEKLTGDGTIRNNFGRVSANGKTIYFTSNKRNRNFFDVYSMDVGTGKTTLLYQFDGNASIAAVNDAGNKIVVSRSGTRFSLDNDLYLIDLKTKKEIHLTPHDGASEFGNVRFLADGIIFTTNDGREFENLAQMRRKNAAVDDWSTENRTTDIVDGADHDLGGVAMNDDAGIMAYSANVDGYSEIFLRKVETDGKPLISVIDKEAAKVALPGKGIASGLTFSPDEKKLAFTFSSPNRTGDIWVYEIASKKLTRVTNSDLAGIDAETFVEPRLIKYKTFDGKEIPAWYYTPRKADRLPEGTKFSKINYSAGSELTPNAPVIVSVHGGPEGQERPGFNALYQYYLSRGYAILAPNVRGSTGYGKTYSHLDDVEKREDSVQDLAAAADWLTTKGGADKKRIAIMGGSYGGYMTMAAVTLYPDLWAAAVNTVGIVNWETFLMNTSGYRRRQREVEYGRLDKNLAFLRAISPIKKVDRIKTPLFVIHGKNDPRVPYTEAEQIVASLKKRGATVEYKLFDDEGHGISKLKNRLELYPLVADFLDKYMKPETAATEPATTRYGLFGKMRVKPGMRYRVAEILLRDVDEMKAVGCHAYIVTFDKEDMDAIWVMEVWDSEAAHDASLKLPSVQQAIKEAMPMLTGEFSQMKLDVMGGLGLPK